MYQDPTSEPSALARIRDGHPSWTLTRDEQAGMWTAESRPSATAVHVLAARTLTELAARLDDIEPPAGKAHQE